MEPFKPCEQRKSVQLPKAPYNMKDIFSEMIESPDKMYSKLEEFLQTKTHFLHAFIELGGLSKMYSYIKLFCIDNNEFEIMRWLNILNHPNFPIDTELIRTMGIGNFINKQIKSKFNCNDLTGSIQQKWYKFAKNETMLHQNRINTKHVRIADGDLCRKQIIFKKNDKPNKINKGNKITFSNTIYPLQSILKATSNHRININENIDYNNESHSEYIVEYVGIQEEEEHEDMEMDSDSNMDISNDDDIHLMENGFDEIEEEIQWYHPPLMMIEYEEDPINTEGMKDEDERIINKEEILITTPALELESSVVNGGYGCGIMMLTDYPHWSEIEKYRQENEQYAFN